VEQTGGPLDLYDQPANTFVAGFIGSPAMNLIPATLQRRGGSCEAVFANGNRVTLTHAIAAHEGQPAIFGIRPEHCTIGAGGGLEVEVVQIYCRYLEQEVTATIRDRTHVRAGDRITLVPDSARAHLFEPASGKRLAA
ncbi:MAG: sugar ABC transporter ATP-binding protein, partial [Burkholderiaceae bacterium]|nr:sugar ABC transporter ATP-binding protein [Burkholderiaceae bacterium]